MQRLEYELTWLRVWHSIAELHTPREKVHHHIVWTKLFPFRARRQRNHHENTLHLPAELQPELWTSTAHNPGERTMALVRQGSASELTAKGGASELTAKGATPGPSTEPLYGSKWADGSLGWPLHPVAGERRSLVCPWRRWPLRPVAGERRYSVCPWRRWPRRVRCARRELNTTSRWRHRPERVRGREVSETGCHVTFPSDTVSTQTRQGYFSELSFYTFIPCVRSFTSPGIDTK